MTSTATTIEPNTIVEYHGSKPAHYGLYLVLGTLDGRMGIIDSANQHLRDVNRRSVTPITVPKMTPARLAALATLKAGPVVGKLAHPKVVAFLRANGLVVGGPDGWFSTNLGSLIVMADAVAAIVKRRRSA